MPVLQSQLNARSADFQANASAMRTLVTDLNAQISTIFAGGGEAARAKHTARGKLLPRDRVQMLLDPGTPFLELAPLAALNMYNNDAPGAGLIAGIGRVSGIDCMIVCNDATVKGAPTTRSPSKSTCAPKKWHSKTACLVSIWSIRAVLICRTKTMCSPTAITLAASSLTKPP